jgi:hypothetical protein
MSHEPTSGRAKDSKTGRVERIEQAIRDIIEPPQPPTLPEFPDSDSITGFMPNMNVEGVDLAKDADDHASKSATGGETRSERRK